MLQHANRTVRKAASYVHVFGPPTVTQTSAKRAADLQEIDLLFMASPPNSKRAKRTPKQTSADEAGPYQREVKTAELLTSDAWGQVCT